MVKHFCDVCGEPALSPVLKGIQFVGGNQLPALEMEYKGVRLRISASKTDVDQPEASDLCRECLLKAVAEGVDRAIATAAEEKARTGGKK